VTVEKMFWPDPYLTETNANIVSISENKITIQIKMWGYSG
jgi:Ser-tRNA(Ala) deacylase AlaX